MTLMQGDSLGTWELTAALLTVLAIAATWLLVVTGRDRSPRRQRRGEDTLERYGDIEEDRAPLSKFLIWTYVGVGFTFGLVLLGIYQLVGRLAH